MATTTKPVKKLICCCCGKYTKGRQWWNRDTGYGLCPDCGDFIAKRETPREMEKSYGVKGIHYAISKSIDAVMCVNTLAVDFKQVRSQMKPAEITLKTLQIERESNLDDVMCTESPEYQELVKNAFDIVINYFLRDDIEFTD